MKMTDFEIGKKYRRTGSYDSMVAKIGEVYMCEAIEPNIVLRNIEQGIKVYLTETPKNMGYVGDFEPCLELPKCGDTVWVRDYGDEWEDRTFLAYNGGSECPYLCVSGYTSHVGNDGSYTSWRQLRTEPPKDKLELRINGKVIDLSDESSIAIMEALKS